MEREEIEKITSKEPDISIFEHCWLLCVVYRCRWHLNWYVCLPEWHELRDMDYSYYLEDHKWHPDLEKMKRINWITVHRWLTFAWTLERFLRLQWNDITFAFWFDTAHSGDAYVQEWIDREFGMDWEYRDINYVTEQTKKLAEQLE